MKIIGIEHTSVERLKTAVQAGGRFVVFQYCISLLVVSFKRASNIYFIPPGDPSFAKGLPFSLISLVLGWWGIPWGPIWTISTVFTNSRGGRDVTAAVMDSLLKPAAAPAGQAR